MSVQLTPEDLRKAQLLQLSILKEVHRICVKHQISYFLSDGTLLGAVRHKGFIPWDDDLDIGMLREAYIRFCEICKTELADAYFLQTPETDRNYGHVFGKLMIKDTLWLEKTAEYAEKKSGIYIDIFPYDTISTNKIVQKIQSFFFLLFKGIYLYKKKYISAAGNDCKKFFKTAIKKILSVMPDNAVSFLLNNTMIDFFLPNALGKCCVTKFGGNYYNNQNPKEVFQELELAQFEDDFFYIPKRYDTILKKLYGDYMVLPPESRRIPQHTLAEYHFGNQKSVR